MATIAAACDQSPDVARMVLGIHLEGPFLSEREGYRGLIPPSHPRPRLGRVPGACRPLGQADRPLHAGAGTPGAIEFIRRRPRVGSDDRPGPHRRRRRDDPTAVRGRRPLSTHLGNGIAAHLPRHPNPIWDQAAHDELFASFIADGHHLDPATLRVLARAKGLRRLILVSDASPLAGLPPGTYGDWAVDPSGKIVVAGTPYLAGSNQGLEIGLQNLMAADPWLVAEALSSVTSNPARLLGHAAAKPLEPGEPANLVIFHRPEPTGFVVQRRAWTASGRSRNE